MHKRQKFPGFIVKCHSYQKASFDTFDDHTMKPLGSAREISHHDSNSHNTSLIGPIILQLTLFNLFKLQLPKGLDTSAHPLAQLNTCGTFKLRSSTPHANFASMPPCRCGMAVFRTICEDF